MAQLQLIFCLFWNLSASMEWSTFHTHVGWAEAGVHHTAREKEKGLHEAGASLRLRWNPIVHSFVFSSETCHPFKGCSHLGASCCSCSQKKAAEWFQNDSAEARQLHNCYVTGESHQGCLVLLEKKASTVRGGDCFPLWNLKADEQVQQATRLERGPLMGVRGHGMHKRTWLDTRWTSQLC